MKVRGIPLLARIEAFHARLQGYRRNAGPGIVEFTVQEAKDIDELLDDVIEVLEKLDKLNEAKKKRRKKK